MNTDACSSIVRLNIGGSIFCTTVDTLTHREPHSMLAAMFSGRHTVHKDSDTGCVFVDRDGTHFRHILNWLRDGVAPNLSDLERLELLREAEYYQLLGLVERINMVLNKKKVDGKMDTDLTRTDIIKCVQSNKKYRLKLRGVNLSGLDLSNLDLSNVDLSRACLKNTNFSGAILRAANFSEANLEGADLKGADLLSAIFTGANLQHADLRHVRYMSHTLDGITLRGAILN
ncbi:FH protein interacting protein FIP2 [Helianthus annuus]|uniref:FH protein interacting protein FIP2 n=1 Tax=Helianthus annuus TaxID=4232 RepID=UPI000B8F0144|nr:FH protein interacting protein FIP2 [Helianthus annuus]